MRYPFLIRSSIAHSLTLPSPSPTLLSRSKLLSHKAGRTSACCVAPVASGPTVWQCSARQGDFNLGDRTLTSRVRPRGFICEAHCVL
ncbi:hypothetical protein SCHPADRAFT_340006 [Schizopora paradoxa]|uniref:Uncharacterized protein n=1 Tax=Schizopora paradoxa TaxID=27342 RepID=A0A0H2RQI3_9AGAM|nr:hypothetical protein SCHPADRAFT_340006 [Schizopora paradoxa]